MARGDVGFVADTIGGGVEILNRKEFEAVPMTVDFDGVTTTDADGDTCVLAGTPVDKDGKPVTATPWTGAVGILLHDVYPEYPQGAALKKAYIHVTRAQAHNSLTYDKALVDALNSVGCRIALEEPIVVA